MNNNCPCCSTSMLRHIRYSQVYWYCSNCKQEMPNLLDRVRLNKVLAPFGTDSDKVSMKFPEKSSDLQHSQGKIVQNAFGMG
ncbi:MAG: hypothetical protein SWJ54_06685 [Cyanobacteriota bacterium]|nr:hypothetical protein [Cyanobacteriota bacterium]